MTVYGIAGVTSALLRARTLTRKSLQAFMRQASDAATLPASVPRKPKVSIPPESSTATRLIKTPIIETSLKLVAMIGVVEIWAATETARTFESSSGGFLNRRRMVHFTNVWSGFQRTQFKKIAVL
jgi:hypothetical protein